MHHADLALAVIGGTGVYRIAELEDVESHLPETRYGFPSGPVRVGRIGGKGGGRPDMAQGGGSDGPELLAALADVPAWVAERLGG